MHLLDILTFAASASAFVLDTRQTTPPASCAKGVHVIAAGGANSPDPSSIGLLGSLANLVVSKIPGSNFISLPYDKVEIAPQKLKPNSIPDGINTFGQYVSQYHTSCPNTKIVVLGYSSGAVITMQALRTGVVPQSLARNTIIANVAYGEQTFVPGQSYDRGTCKNGEGTQPTDNPASLGAYIPLSESYSDVNDPQSCSGPPQDYEVHLSYPGKYDQVAAQFVVQQYNSLGGGSSSSSSSASSSASASSSSAGGLGGLGGFGSATSSSSASATTSSSASAGGLGGFGSAASSASASATSAASSASASLASATTSAASVASAASSSAAAIGGGASSAVTSAMSAPASAASSVAGSASAAATSLASYNPANGQAILSPSTTLINAVCFGVLIALGIALH